MPCRTLYNERVVDFTDAEIASLWNDEIERRVSEIESGVEQPIPVDEVMKQARRAIDEARRVSSARK